MRFPPSPPSWSIRVKSLVLAAGYLLVLSAVYGAFTVYLVRRERSEAQDRFEQTAHIVAAQVDAYIASGAERLQTVARLPGLSYGLQTIQEAGGTGYIPPWTTLHYLFFRSPVFNGGVLLLDRVGKVLWTEPPGLPWFGQTLIDLEPIAGMYQSRHNLISAVLPSDRLLAQPHVLIGEPIVNDSGELQGVLAGVIDLTTSDVGEMLHAVSTADGRFVEVADQKGVVLAATDATRRFQAAHPFPTDGDRMMLASAPFAHAPWRIVAGQPAAQALAAVGRFQAALLIIGVVLLVVAGAVAVPILNGFVRGIKQLKEAAETVARGDLSRPVSVGNRRDELAALAQAFDQMRLELGRSQRSLEHRLDEREQLIRQLVHAHEELRGAQQRLIEAERFAAIGELSAAVAHGIRNPVSGIKAAAHCARLDLPGTHPVRENISDIIAEADKLEARIKTLLDFAKPFVPHPVRCRPAQLVGGAVASLQGPAAAHGVEVVVDLDPALPDAELDYAQFEQVLLALLWNAVEAMPQGGRITISGRTKDDGQGLRLAVSDTGPGIATEQLQRVFELFFTTKSHGTGLGLAVAKKIIERHGGTISVDSVLGRGATFTIEVPCAPPSTASARGANDSA